MRGGRGRGEGHSRSAVVLVGSSSGLGKVALPQSGVTWSVYDQAMPCSTNKLAPARQDEPRLCRSLALHTRVWCCQPCRFPTRYSQHGLAALVLCRAVQSLSADDIFKANSLGWCIEWVSAVGHPPAHLAGQVLGANRGTSVGGWGRWASPGQGSEGCGTP